MEHYDECKMLLIVNMSLKMGRGKVVAQCCHAAIGVYDVAKNMKSPHLEKWRKGSATKVALKSPDLDELLALRDIAKGKGVPHYIVIDEGRTQIAPDSQTILAIGPAPSSVLSTFTKHLKLY